MKNNEIIIPKAGVQLLNKYITGELSVLSPFNLSFPEAPQVDDFLKDKNLFHNGKPAGLLEKILPVLTGAHYLSCVKRISNDGAFEYTVYANDACTDFAGLIAREKDFVVSYPPQTPEILNSISELSGTLALKAADFDVSLPVDESIVFAAFVDLFRTQVLESVCRERDFAYSGNTPDEIAAALNTKSADFRRLLVLIRSAFQAEDEKTSGPPAQAIQGLLEKKLIESKAGRYFLTGAALAFSSSMIYPEYVYTCSAYACAPGNTILRHGVLFVQWGTRSVLMVESPSKDVIALRAASPFDMVSFFGAYLTDFSLMKKLANNGNRP